MPEYLSIHHVAQQMGLSERTVRELCQRGELPGAIQEHERGPWRIPLDVVDDWISAKIARRRIWRRVISFAGIGTVLAVIFAFVSGLADLDKAKLQLQRSGILKSYAPAKEGEILIIVFDYYRTENLTDYDIDGQIVRGISDEVKKYGFTNISIVNDPRLLKADDRDRAQKIGLANNASIVIWGEDTGVTINTRFLNIKNPEVLLSEKPIDDTQHSQLATLEGYQVFVTQHLPQQLTKLSLFAISQSLIIDGKIDDAIEILEICVSGLDQDNTFEGEEYTYQYLGWLYTVKPDFDKALAAFNKVLELTPNNYIAYNNRGILYGTFSKLPESYADFEKAISIDPTNKAAYYNRGLNYAYTQKYEPAIDDFTKAINADPKYAESYYNRGLSYLFLNNYNDAISDFSKTIEINPQHLSAYVNRSGTYLKMSVNEDGVGNLKKAAENATKAAEDATKAIEINPDYKFAYINRSSAYILLNQNENAIKDVTKIIQLNPQDAYWYFLRGGLYQELGDIKNATIDYQSCIKYTNDPELKAKAGNALSELIQP